MDIGQDTGPARAASPLGAAGQPVTDVVVEIDYNIIQHFSEHLYGSPNKAVEELVSNSFDAFASNVYVYIPGRFTRDYVVVWDDGGSMDVDDIRKLWWIAQSPKQGDRIAQSSDGRSRAMIGKFGIGKLASYAVGYRITHLCRRGDRFLQVTVDYRDVPHIQDGVEQDKYRTPILELTEKEALDSVLALFGAHPKARTRLWEKNCWTLAIIDQLKENVHLTEGRLSWVIGNGMPLRPDFKVWVNDEQVESKLARGAMISWDLAEPKLREGFAAAWKSARNKAWVDGDYDLLLPSEAPDGRAAVWMPALGTVHAEVHLFEKSLNKLEPRSYGFFVMVRDRLLNPNDAQMFLSVSDPSFGTFYRSQYVIYANGLDQDLLADRERLRVDTPRTRELAVLQDALYRASRHELERSDQRTKQDDRSETLLPVDSREHFREPLAALLLRHDGAPGQAFDPATAAHVDRAPLGATEPIAVVDRESGGFLVNAAHPLFNTIEQRVGENKRAREALRVLDLFAVAERLFEGFLYDLGLPSEQIDRILAWRDGLLRAMALRFATAPAEEVVAQVRQASYAGDKPFEKALARLFQRMGFEASRDGAPGRKDILVIAPIGRDEYRFTVEAKGSKDAIGNDDAEVGGAVAHRDQVGARFVLIVAREFVGFRGSRSERPAILQECEAAGHVSIMTVEALVELLEAILTYHYPLEKVLPVLEEIQAPGEKLKRIASLRDPTAGFDFRGVLEQIWRLQQDMAARDMVAYRHLWQSGPDRWGVSDLPDFSRKLIALEVLSNGLLQVSENEHAITLHQSPAIVAERIQLAVEIQRQPD